MRRAWLKTGARYTRPETGARAAVEREIERLGWQCVDDHLRLPAGTRSRCWSAPGSCG